MPGHRPARLLLGGDRLRARRALHRVEVAEALPLVVPRPAVFAEALAAAIAAEVQRAAGRRSGSGSPSPSTCGAASSPKPPRELAVSDYGAPSSPSCPAGSTPPCSPTTSGPTAGSCACCPSTTASATRGARPRRRPRRRARRAATTSSTSDRAGALLAGSALTDDAVDVPDGHYTDESMRATVVANRNAIFAMVAVGVAVAEGAAAVGLGDPRRRPLHLPRLPARRSSTPPSTWPSSPTRASSPTASGCWRRSSTWSKADIVRRGAELGVDFADTWSCYKGGDGALRHVRHLRRAPRGLRPRRRRRPHGVRPGGDPLMYRRLQALRVLGVARARTASATTTRAPASTATTTRSR